MPPETLLLQPEAQHLLLLPWLGRNTPVLPVPLADTGHISLPTSSQIPQIPLFWGFSSKLLPRLGALSGALANLTAPLWSYLYPQHHPPTAHSHGQTRRQASLLLLAPTLSQITSTETSLALAALVPAWRSASEHPFDAAALLPGTPHTAGIACIILGVHDRQKTVESLWCC